MAQQKTTAQIVVNYNDGSRERYYFQARDLPPELVAKRIEMMIQLQVLTIQLRDRLKLIPLSSVRSLEVTPGPESELDFALVGAEELE